MNKRRVLALAMIVALVSGLVAAGCPAPPAPPAPAPPAPAPPAPAPPAPPPPVPVEVITWKVQSSYDAANPAHIISAKLCDAVTLASGGRLVFKSFTGGSISPACKELDGVDTRVLEATYTCPMYNIDKWPVAGLYSARPGQMRSHCFMTWFNHGGGVELFNKMTEGYNLLTLPGTAPRPPEIFLSSTVPITSLADIKGLRIRTAGDGGEILTRMGASVIFLPGGELYEAMERGVIDAFDYSTPAVNWAMSFQEIAHYLIFSATRAPSDPLTFTVNTDAWAELTPDLKQLVQDEVYRWTTQHDLEEYVVSIENVEKFRDYGCDLSHLPAEVELVLLETTRDFYDEKAAEEPPIYGETLEAMRAFAKAYGAYSALDAPYVVLD